MKTILAKLVPDGINSPVVRTLLVSPRE